ncbi:MAG: alkaline phosphatase D family protein [Actinomycetota bacterium]|nr:alkaline phosphatase D family protein [Actinomycetota bacterium]
MVTTSPITRRRFLAGAGGVVLAGGLTSARSLAQSGPAVARGGRFTQSVASGQPTTNGITLWTKVSELERPGRMQFEISTEPDFRSVLIRRSVTPDAGSDLAITTRVESARLRPSERYFYRFFTCDQTSPVGRFRTARPADSREPVRVAFFSCQDYESGFYTAHAGIAQEEDLDLVICLGDYIYERSFDPNKTRVDRTGPNGTAEVQTLGEYRDKYRLYHTDPNLLAVRERHPLYTIWDDHEVEDNYAADKPGDATQRRTIEFAQRRANGYRAFFEHMPQLEIAGGRDRIYGTIPLGRNADVFLLDQRQFRSDQPCGDAIAPPPGTCGEKDAPGRTMLGAEQKAWFKAALAGSQATWKLVGNQVQMMSLDYVTGQPFVVDSWDGYTAERRELGEFVLDRKIQNVSFLTGDIHTFFAGNVSPTGRQDRSGQPAAFATEFVGGSITSEGIADRQGGEQFRDQFAAALDTGAGSQNPQIKYSNQSFKGYGVLEARPDELLVQYKAPRTVRAAQSNLFTLQRFRVKAGVANVEVLGAG